MSTKKSTESFAQELKQRFGLVLVGEYLGAHKPVQFTCSQGHINTAIPTNLLRRGYQCKQCKHGRAIVPKLVWDNQAVLKLKQMVESGAELDEIAQAFSTTRSAILNACEKFSVSRTKLASSYKLLQAELAAQQRQLLTAYDNYQGVRTMVDVLCQNNHQVSQLAANIIYNQTACPSCTFLTGKSVQETNLASFIKQNYVGWIEENDRTLLEGQELDIVLPDLGLAFEYNGEYWHSDKYVDKYYHQNKTTKLEQLGFKLIHVPEHSWLTKQPQWQSFILNQLGQTKTKIAARHTKVVKLEHWPKQWLDENHLQGSGSPTGVNYALTHNNHTVAVMTFAKPRFNDKYQWELVRFCTALNTHVPGAASKLLKAFEREYLPESIISYANRYWSQGNVYKRLGFEFQYNTEPGYYYCKKLDVISRYQAQKHKLPQLLKLYDPELTEYQNMQLNGYHRVWDSGNQVWVKFPRPLV